ncbi:hypothetical protein LRP30_30290 [Bradyrhizobium sp. C-145]|nr:hypothetical protein [Bradyrhizobium sp. C-145]UQR61225.1 hypothetical protein LRP30_30290 [Bradyrhizobium sp. C-145]
MKAAIDLHHIGAECRIDEIAMGRRPPVIKKFGDLDVQMVEEVEGWPGIVGLSARGPRRAPIDLGAAPRNLHKISDGIVRDRDAEIGVAAGHRLIRQAAPLPDLDLHDCGLDKPLRIRPAATDFNHAFVSLRPREIAAAARTPDVRAAFGSAKSHSAYLVACAASMTGKLLVERSARCSRAPFGIAERFR